jgi:hypothetical protein
VVRYIGMDVHREFAQLAVVEDGLVRGEGRIGRDAGGAAVDPAPAPPSAARRLPAADLTDIGAESRVTICPAAPPGQWHGS